MKRCTGPCGQRKPETEFAKRAQAKDGLQAWCKECRKNEPRNRRPRDPGRQRVAQLKHLYGLTLTQWHEMLVEQSGLCALCDEPMRNPHTDHSHVTGKVRGLLCLRCNTMLGHVERLGLAHIQVYLEKS